MSDQERDDQQLAKHYASMYDEELLRLSAEYHDLTDIAQQALREELRHRKLAMPDSSTPPAEDSDADQEQVPLPMDMTEDGNVLLGSFSSQEDATIAYWALEMAGIPSKVVAASAGSMRSPRLEVAPEDADRAQEVLAEPISEEVMEQHQAAKDAGDFEAPNCPVCSTPDPLLETADPVNEWFCESCGHQWKDELATGTE